MRFEITSERMKTPVEWLSISKGKLATMTVNTSICEEISTCILCVLSGPPIPD
jgi:hypothetical protein